MNANYNLPERGLTVLELIFVVAIVAVLVGIAVPPMLEARRSAQETRAVANLRMVSASQMLYFANRNQFASFEMLFSGGILSEGQFERGAAGGGPKGGHTEAISDGVYLYTIRYSRDAQGITLDADPIESNTSTYRRFRFRLGRRVTGGAWANEGLLLVAPPSVTSPPPAAYVPFDP